MGNCTTGSVTGTIADTKYLSKHRKHLIKRKDRFGRSKVMWEDSPGATQVLIGFVYHRKGARGWRATSMFEGCLKGLGVDFTSRFKAGQALADYYGNSLPPKPPVGDSCPEEGGGFAAL
jgi:hypothetical protein